MTYFFTDKFSVFVIMLQKDLREVVRVRVRVCACACACACASWLYVCVYSCSVRILRPGRSPTKFARVTCGLSCPRPCRRGSRPSSGPAGSGIRPTGQPRSRRWFCGWTRWRPWSWRRSLQASSRRGLRMRLGCKLLRFSGWGV